jgi:putative transcriptional regulator
MGDLFKLCHPAVQSGLYRNQRIHPHIIPEHVVTVVVFYPAVSVDALQIKPVSAEKRCRHTRMKNNIRVERAISEITQAELADKVNVSRQTINSIESNKYIPSALLALKIARVFGKAVEDIFLLDDKD